MYRSHTHTHNVRIRMSQSERNADEAVADSAVMPARRAVKCGSGHISRACSQSRPTAVDV